jgi:hypothetical protein
MDREKEQDKPAFDIEERGYRAKAWYLKDIPDSKGDALIEIFAGDELLREFLFPAYKIWNIAAHFGDIVDGEIAKHDGGYRMAAWNGITPTGDPQPLP